MKKEEFVKVMSYMGMIYGKEFKNEELSAWYTFFYDENCDIFKAAIKNLVEKESYIPTVAKIKAEMNKIKNPELKDVAEEEWLEILKAIRKYGYYQTDKALESLKPFTREIVERIGFQNICISENIDWERKIFIETFKACNKSKEYSLIENKNESKLLDTNFDETDVI